MIYSNYKKEEELKQIIEDTFDTCENNRDEIRWLISIIRSLIRVPNKITRPIPETYKLNLWQYQLNPIIQNYFKKWKM